MFKSLREKVLVSDTNSKNESGEQNLSRFSSINSLVSDVGSVFSKVITIPQHVQPSSRNSKFFQDNESVSEYEDSIVQGDIINKEELFQRYQRAQTLSKRYKTRSLEVMEAYKKLEIENMKLTQTLTESQDCNIKRVAELREQIGLDKKAKADVEENYLLMINENTELINVLRLQISLLKEGKDLPTELESQIKEKYDLEVHKQKKKDDEIKELRSTMVQKDNLLQRCKDKITILNSQLMEFKAKANNTDNASVSGESLNDQFSSDLSKQRFQHVTALENLQKEHSERIKIMLCDFEEKKTILEAEIQANFEEKCSKLKQDLNELKEQMSRISQDNERLQEQVNIKTKIIEELIDSQDKIIIEKSAKSYITIDKSDCYEEANTFSSLDIFNTQENSQVNELRNENKFLLGRIDQMEALKLQTEEEISKIEEELKNVELKLKKEKEDCEVKCNSYESKLEQMKVESNYNISRNEVFSSEVLNINALLLKKKEESDTIFEDLRESKSLYQSLEIDWKKSKDEIVDVLLKLEKMCKSKEELEQQFQSIFKDYESDKFKLQECQVKCKELQDKYDEISSCLENEIQEKRKLSMMLNDNKKSTKSQITHEDALGLKILEMRQRYDQEIEDCRNRITEKMSNIQELEIAMTCLKEENEKVRKELIGAESVMEELIIDNKNKAEENENFKNKVQKIEDKINTLLNNEQKYLKIIEEKDGLTINIKTENENLKLRVESLALEVDKLTQEETDIVAELDAIKLKNEEMSSECLGYITEKEYILKQLSSKDEELQHLIEENQITLDKLSEILQENLQSKSNNENLIKDVDKAKVRIQMSEEYELKYASLKEESETQVREINKLRLCLQNEEECSRNKESCISTAQLSLEDKEQEMIKLTKDMKILEEEVNIVKDYLNKFQQWNDEVVVIAECGNDCSLNSLNDKDLWSSNLKEGYKDLDELLSLGSSLQRVLSSWRLIHNQLQMSKDEIRNLKSDLKQGNNIFMKVVKELCIPIEDGDEELNEDAILKSLSQIRDDKDNINIQLSEMENIYKTIEEMLTKEDFVYHGIDDKSSALTRLKKLIIDRINCFRTQLQDNEDHRNKLKNEKEVILKKYDKMLNDKMQHFKFLSNLFELTNTDYEHKSFSKMVIKGMKEYVQKNTDVVKELSETLSKVGQLEQELTLSREEGSLKQFELIELTKNCDEERSRLSTMRQELDRSLYRLNEFSQEKGRIDEEKQSMKKELNELNEKIQQLKGDFEKQISEKQKLEKQFDESLEKVKTNHLALEETYKQEIEKQHGYQHYLEEQISVNRDETSRKLIEKEHVSNIKLEEVLKQSEQLLVLNTQYKDLLDKSKIESSVVSENMKQLMFKYESLELDVQRYKIENETLSSKMEELKEIHELTKMKRDDFKMNLDSMINETKKSSEILNKSQAEEKFIFLDQIKELECKNNASERELEILKESHKIVESEYNELKQEKTNLIEQMNQFEKQNTLFQRNLNEKLEIIKNYESEIAQMKSEMKDTNEDREREIYEFKQQFEEDKSNLNDDHNHRVKKLAKDFNERILGKEQEFQKTFQEALENIRKEEARQKSDLKSEIGQLNNMVIELETEKNSLLISISDLEDDVKKTGSLMQIKDVQIQSLEDKILGYKSEINELELKVLNMKSVTDDMDQRSKINQTVETHSYFEESTSDTVNANDHDVLQMHCADVEEQVRQLHLDNIRLKQTIVENQTSSSMSPREHIISVTKSHLLSNQPSFDNVSLKSSNINYLRSPNTSCSEYQFCPYPITEATEYEYLRDILVKYMTGLETNTLARVLCTVMKFTNNETNRILRFEQDKKRVLQIFPR